MIGDVGVFVACVLRIALRPLCDVCVCLRVGGVDVLMVFRERALASEMQLERRSKHDWRI